MHLMFLIALSYSYYVSQKHAQCISNTFHGRLAGNLVHSLKILFRLRH